MKSQVKKENNKKKLLITKIVDKKVKGDSANLGWPWPLCMHCIFKL